jgi:hypothetical protein
VRSSPSLNRDTGGREGGAAGRGGRRLAIDGRRASREVGPRNGRGNEGGGKAQGLIAIKRDLREEREARGDGGRGQSCGGAIGRSRGKESGGRKEKGRREVGSRCQLPRGKRKEERGPGPLRVGGKWAGGLKR